MQAQLTQQKQMTLVSSKPCQTNNAKIAKPKLRLLRQR